MQNIRNILFTLIALTALAAPAAAGLDAEVYVGHGIPGGDLGLDDALPVDVNVVGVGCVLTAFQFGEFAGPLALPPATYTIEIYLADATPCAGTLAITATVPLNMSEKATILAHLDGSGNPTASKFGNDFTPSAAGEGRLSVHHSAAAPAVDVWASAIGGDGASRIFSNVSNGDQGTVDVPTGKWKAALRPADDRAIVLGPAGLRIQNQALVNVYAVGSLSTGSLQLLVQRVRIPTN